jgi:hypothetical protein
MKERAVPYKMTGFKNDDLENQINKDFLVK